MPLLSTCDNSQKYCFSEEKYQELFLRVKRFGSRPGPDPSQNCSQKLSVDDKRRRQQEYSFKSIDHCKSTSLKTWNMFYDNSKVYYWYENNDGHVLMKTLIEDVQK